MGDEIRKRAGWIKVYQETKDGGLTGLKRRVSRLTLRKRLQRYQEHGESGLESRIRRPHHSLAKKVHAEQEQC